MLMDTSILLGERTSSGLFVTVRRLFNDGIFDVTITKCRRLIESKIS